MKTNALLLAALALAACSPDFDPASKIEKLRVLAVKAEWPEIDPDAVAAPSSTSLTALVVRADFASDPARPTTVVYLACVPEPGNPLATPCSMLALLRDPTAALLTLAEASCTPPPPGWEPPPFPPMSFAGVEQCDARGSPCTPVPIQLPDGTLLGAPALTLPSGYAAPDYGFGTLCADPANLPATCILGAQADVLAFAVDAAWTEIAAAATGSCPLASMVAQLSSLWSSREHVLSLKRVRIRGPSASSGVDPGFAEANRNPGFGGIDAGGTTLAEGTATPLPAVDVNLAPTFVESAQTYAKRYADGSFLETATEDWVYSWFSTAGEMEDLHTRPPDVERWKLTAADAGRTALVAAVVRDLRGGIAWQVREVALQP